MNVSDGQSLYDIACKALGSAAAAIQIALLNGISVTDNLLVGQDINIPDVVNKDIATFYANNGIDPATGMSDTELEELKISGLGYMALGIDFIVS